MALVATVLSLVAHPALPEPAVPPRRDVCRTPACERRVAHRHTRHRWWRTTIPYRAWLRSTRMCESGGRYGISTGNGFYGAYQFTIGSWAAVGGRGLPHMAAPLEQDYRAVRLLWVQGRGAWPVCG